MAGAKKNLGALAGAAEVDSKAVRLYVENSSTEFSILERLRVAHIERLIGITDQRAAMIASLIYAGGVS